MNLEDRFEKDVENHNQTVMLDWGMFRHLVNSIPDTNVYRFNITTWPGYLAITGDMGAYTFSRIPDMFEFFRGEGKPSYQYWAEKAVAVDQTGPIIRFSREKFCEVIMELARSYEVNQVCDGDKDAFYREVKRRVLSFENEYEAGAFANDFTWGRGMFADNPFQDWWDYDFREIDPRYKWCCKAIRWAINKYDEGK